MNITGEIRCYLGDSDYACLKYSEGKSSFAIDIVDVPASSRKQGIGTMLIEHVLVMANSMKKDVYVTARPFYSASQENIERLVRYYERFGFRVYDRGLTVAYMVRKCPAE
jgi:predicted GNAT family acetyltransferase